MRFNLWIEERNRSEVADAILGVVGAGEDLTPQEKNHLLQRNTKDFSSSISRKIKGLGVLKRSSNYSEIASAIDKGIKISSIVSMVN
jgi:hypothetical protein